MTFDDFLKQYQALKQSLPLHPTRTFGEENSEFAAYSYRIKHCYYCFDTVDSVNCSYCFDCVRSTDCVDCDYCVECELLYECVDCFRAYNSAYLDYCGRIYDSFFCWDCDDSHDLFGCTHLKQRQYCIFNKQYTKEEYRRRVAELLRRPPEENLRELRALIAQYPLGPTNVTSSHNSDYGNHVHYNKNCYLCFDTVHSDDCAYMYDSAFCKDSYDLTYCYKAESCYECSDSSRIYNSDHVEWSIDCFDSSYLSGCKDCYDCFGCVGAAHKKFCILNRQYTEGEYRKLVSEIRATAREM